MYQFIFHHFHPAISSCVTLKDLCRLDKERVKKLVEDLAIVGTEKVRNGLVDAE